MPTLAESRDLEEENPVVVEHLVDRAQKGCEMAHANVFRHFETGDFTISTFVDGDISIIHAKDLALAFLNTSFPESVVAPRGLVPAQSNAGGFRAVGDTGVFGECAPSAPDVEERFTGLEPDLFADNRQLIVLELFEGFFDGGVGDQAGGVNHAWTKEPAVEVVTAVVMITDLFFVCTGCLVNECKRKCSESVHVP